MSFLDSHYCSRHRSYQTLLLLTLHMAPSSLTPYLPTNSNSQLTVVLDHSVPTSLLPLSLAYSTSLYQTLTKDNGSSFLKLYFLDYAITVVPILSLFPLHPAHPTPSGDPPHYCSRPWVMRISSLAAPFPILCFTFP